MPISVELCQLTLLKTWWCDYFTWPEEAGCINVVLENVKMHTNSLKVGERRSLRILQNWYFVVFYNSGKFITVHIPILTIRKILCFACERPSVLWIMYFFLFNAPGDPEQLSAVPEQKNISINTLPSRNCIIQCCIC